MTKKLPTLAKRLLAFTLALVLMLSLVPAIPLTVDATAWAADPDFDVNSKYAKVFTSLSFSSSDTDLVFEGNQAYDWTIKFSHKYEDPLKIYVYAIITDANGNKVAEYSSSSSQTVASNSNPMVLQSSHLNLSTNVYGTFTLNAVFTNSGSLEDNGTYAFSVEKTFSRVPTVKATVTSRSNPDNAFTFADPLDLVLNIKKNDGIATAYNAAVTVTKGTELLDERGFPLPESTNITLNVKDLVNLPAITTAGTYNVNLTLTDSRGNIALQESFPFCVVSLDSNVTASITSEISTDLVFDYFAPDLKVNLAKTDGVAEKLITVVTVTDASGSTSSETFETTDASAAITPNLSDLKAGTYTMTAVVTDDAGNQRATTSVDFKYNKGTPLSCNFSNRNPNTGNIFYDKDDVKIRLRINKASTSQPVNIKVVGTLNGQPFESQINASTSTSNNVDITLDNSVFRDYGVYENISAKIYNASGNLMGQSSQSLSFSRVLDTSNPGDLPLLNVNDHFTSGKGDATLKIPLAAQAGANMWRASIPWKSTEKSKGVYALPDGVDTVMATTQTQGMQALIILAYENDLYGEVNPTSDTWVNAYAKYCGWVANELNQLYPDLVVGFEIWNEWNHASMSKIKDAKYRTGDYYAKVVIAASKAIKKVNPNFKVIAGATAGDAYLDYDVDASNSNTFVHAMLGTSGFVSAVDGISFHTYSSEETTTIANKLRGQRTFEYISPTDHKFAARFENFQTILNSYGAGNKEIWLTETGWTTNSELQAAPGSDGRTHITYGADEKDAAAYLVQMYAWALYDGTVDRIFWYDLMNDISNQTGIWANNQTESNYGLIHNWDNSGDQPLAYSAKQGYVTMCALSSMLGNATNGQEVELESGIAAYKFTDKNGTDLVVAWTTSDTVKTLNCKNGTMTVTDMYGNTTSNLTTATLSECPIYITYSDSGTLSVG